MAGDSIQLVVVTPVRQLLSESVTEVQLPGADGYLGILPGHAPLITELGIGELTYRTAGGQTGLLAVIRGFAEVLPAGVSSFLWNQSPFTAPSGVPIVAARNLS